MNDENEVKTGGGGLLAEALKTPADWCLVEGVEVMDPDGWRGKNGRPWTDPISQAEFKQRLIVCTMRRLKPGETPWKQIPLPPTTEHHAGSLDLSGEGNGPDPLVAFLDSLAETAIAAAGDTRWHGMRGLQIRKAVEAVYPPIRQQVAEEIAVAIADVEGYDGTCDCQDCVSTGRLVEMAREIGGRGADAISAGSLGGATWRTGVSASPSDPPGGKAGRSESGGSA